LKILLFDGHCNLCNSAVKFVIKRDKRALIKLASIQSDTAEKLLFSHNFLAETLDSFVYIRDERILTKSSAALHLMKDIGGFYSLLYAFIIIPQFIRDSVYSFIAKNRYKWFGKLDTCMLPDKENIKRFL
jgi:predicted DCC family thiol-disulfide oxidoreductase YuxK